MPKIENINMSVSAYMQLKGHDINDINEMSLVKVDDMYNWKNLGRRTLQEILDIMKEYGVKFAKEDTD